MVVVQVILMVGVFALYLWFAHWITKTVRAEGKRQRATEGGGFWRWFQWHTEHRWVFAAFMGAIALAAWSSMSIFVM